MNRTPRLWGNCWRCGVPREGDHCASCGAQRAQDPFLGVRGGPVRLVRHLMVCPNVSFYRAQGARNLVRMVRVLPQSLQPDRAEAQRFILLGRALKGVRHPNLMEVYQVEAVPDRHAWLLGEWAPGQSAEALLDQSHPMDLGRAMLLGEQMLSALEQLHKLGYVHGRLGLHAFHWEASSAQGQDWLRLVDLGRGVTQAQLHQHKPAIQAGWRGGSPWERWQAPEVLNGQAPSQAHDVYAVAMCLYKLLTGHLAYRKDTRRAILGARTGNEQERVPLIERRAQLKRHAELCDVLDRALSALPSERFRDAASLRAELAMGARLLGRPRRVDFVKKEAEPRNSTGPGSTPQVSHGTAERARLRRPRRAPLSQAPESADYIGRCSRLLMGLAESLRQQSARLPTPGTEEALVPLLNDFELADRLESSLARARQSEAVFSGPLRGDARANPQSLGETDTFPAEVHEPDEWDLAQVLAEQGTSEHGDRHAWLMLSVASPLLRQIGGRVSQGEQDELRRSLEPLTQLHDQVREVSYNTRRGILSFALACGDAPRAVLSKLLLFLMEFGRRGHTRPPALALVIRWRQDGAAALPPEEERAMLKEAEGVAFRGYDGELLATRDVVSLSGAEELFSPLQGSRLERMSREVMIWSFAG